MKLGLVCEVWLKHCEALNALLEFQNVAIVFLIALLLFKKNNNTKAIVLFYLNQILRKSAIFDWRGG